MKTKIKNVSNETRKFSWVPRYGITLAPNEEIVIDGPLRLKRFIHKKAMQKDVDAGVVSVVTVYDDKEKAEDKTIEVAPIVEKKAPKVSTKKKDQAADKTIEVPRTEDDDLNIPGIQILGEDELDDEVYDEKGDLIKEENPVIIEGINTVIDPEEEEKEEKEEKAVEEKAEDTPYSDMTKKELNELLRDDKLSASVLKKTNKSKLIDMLISK